MNNPHAYVRALVPIAILSAGVAIVSAAVYQLRVGGANDSLLLVADHPAEGTSMNETAPTFELPALKPGPPIAFPPSGHVTVLNFWASWCAPCAIEAPGLQRTWTAYRKRGVRFIGVDQRDSDGAARAFVSEFGISYPSAKDPSGSLADDFALYGLPTTFVVDRDGVLRERFVGYVDETDLRRVLDQILEDGTE